MSGAWFGGWGVLLRTVLVGAAACIALVVLLRVSGKRTLAKLDAFDLVVTVALGSTIASVLTSKDVALAQGVVAFGLLAGLQFVVTWGSVAVAARCHPHDLRVGPVAMSATTAPSTPTVPSPLITSSVCALGADRAWSRGRARPGLAGDRLDERLVRAAVYREPPPAAVATCARFAARRACLAARRREMHDRHAGVESRLERARPLHA